MTRQQSADLYIGIISGTSMDGIDCGVFRFAANTYDAIHTSTSPYTQSLRERLLALRRRDARLSLDRLGELDRELGFAFAQAATECLQRANLAPDDIAAIGCHGQTVRHRGAGETTFSLQLGDAHSIAARTGITTVADFRRADIARGGQAAPLAPLLHDWLFPERDSTVAVVNLGGIANVSLLPAAGAIRGYDTGPANGLMDAWMQRAGLGAFDGGGKRAARGAVNSDWLHAMLDDPYFSLPAPKSTGFEYFNLDWLEQWRSDYEPMDDNDVLATLTALSARSVAAALTPEPPSAVWLAGGGVHNKTLTKHLAAELDSIPVRSISEHGVDADALEAALFAWLARERLANRVTRHSEVTGASASAPLGVVFAAA